MFSDNTSQFEKCPKCRSKNAKEVSFTWWGGALGPKMFNHVKCQTCGKGYNGETGKDNDNKIIVYNLVGFVIVSVLFALGSFLMRSL